MQQNNKLQKNNKSQKRKGGFWPFDEPANSVTDETKKEGFFSGLFSKSKPVVPTVAPAETPTVVQTEVSTEAPTVVQTEVSTEAPTEAPATTGFFGTGGKKRRNKSNKKSKKNKKGKRNQSRKR